MMLRTRIHASRARQAQHVQHARHTPQAPYAGPAQWAPSGARGERTPARGEPGGCEPPGGVPGPALIALAAARAELGLDQRDFEFAVELGQVTTVTAPAAVAGAPPGRRMVSRAELDRLLRQEGFPDALRERLRLVGTATGADLLGISQDRFTRLARAGCVRPARWYVNRYRAVVWLYLADEATAFADEHPDWMTGRLPEEVREQLEHGLDLRARAWRARRVGQLVARAPDIWHEAAVWVALLGPDEAADLLPDSRERLRLTELRPSLLSGRPLGRAADEVAEVSLVADDVEEIADARRCLTAALDRAARAAPPRTGPCCRTVTRQGQRLPWPRKSLQQCGPRLTRRGPWRTGIRSVLPGSVRPDQPKGRR